MRHVHICDPQLQNSGGHYLSHDAQLVRELKRRDIPASVLGRRNAPVEVCGISSEPTFTLDLFHEVSTDPQTWAIENFEKVNQAFLADLLQVKLERLSPEHLVYFPNLIQNQLHAVALWLKRMPAQRRPAVAVMLRFLNHSMEYNQRRKNNNLIALQYRYACRELLAAQPRAVLCADTLELAQAYRDITGMHVLELPNPMDLSDLPDAAPAEPSPGRPVVAYLGHSSPLRGFHFLPEVIKRSLSLPSRPRFVVQVQSREAAAFHHLESALKGLDALAGEDVRIVNGDLNAADYLSLIRQADVVLLPYAPAFYGHGSSGVFTEAASIGKVIVVSTGTVPARQGREFSLGMVTAAQWTAGAAADALAAALRTLPALKERALAAAPRFRADQCAGALWDRLFAAVKPAIAPPLAAAI